MIAVEAIPGQAGFGNVYLVGKDGERDAVLIDPSHSLDRAVALLEARKWKAVAILLTHGHLRHAARAAEAQALLSVPLWAHAGELPSLQRLPVEGDLAGLCGVKTPTVNRMVQDGDVLTFRKLDVRVIGTPGHSPGSVSYLFPGAAFTGDLEGDALGRLSRELAPSDRIYPGHGNPHDAGGLSSAALSSK